MISSKRVRTYYKTFPELFPPGSDFPRFGLDTTDGRAIHIDDLVGRRHFVLFTGATTCPPFRRALGPMEQIRAKYKDRDVEVLAIYVREPHAGERGFHSYLDHRDLDHKLAYANDLARQEGLKIPLLVDSFDEATHDLLGNLPNLVYVVNREGNVVFKSTWLDPKDVDQVLAALVTEDDPSRPLSQTISLSGAPISIG